AGVDPVLKVFGKGMAIGVPFVAFSTALVGSSRVATDSIAESMQERSANIPYPSDYRGSGGYADLCRYYLSLRKETAPCLDEKAPGERDSTFSNDSDKDLAWDSASCLACKRYRSNLRKETKCPDEKATGEADSRSSKDSGKDPGDPASCVAC